MTVPNPSFPSPGLDAARAYAAIFRPARPCVGVVHASMRCGRRWQGLPDPARAGSRAEVAVTMSDSAEGARVFTALSDGGLVETPFGPTAWSPGFGRLTDRFGTRWMVDSEPAPKGGA